MFLYMPLPGFQAASRWGMSKLDFLTIQCCQVARMGIL